MIKEASGGEKMELQLQGGKIRTTTLRGLFWVVIHEVFFEVTISPAETEDGE